MRKLRRALILLVMIAVSVGGAFASGQQEGGSASGEGEAEGKQVVTYWAWSQHIDDVAKGLEAEFEEANPNIDVQPVKLGPWDLHDKVLVSLASGQGAPDVAMLVTRRAKAYVNAGGLMNLSDMAMQYKSDMDQSTWEMIANDEGVFGMPYDRHPAVLFYRADLFEEYGLDPEVETWDQLVQMGLDLQDEYGEDAPKIMWQMYPGGQWGATHFNMFFHSRGGNYYDAEGNVIENNDEALEMLEWWDDVAHNKEVSLLADHHQPDFWNAVNNDEVLTIAAPLWFTRDLKDNAPDAFGNWQVTAFPKWGPNAEPRTGAWGGDVLVIPEQTDVPEAAWKWVEFLTTTNRAQAFAYQEAGSIPAYLPAMNEDALNSGMEVLGGQAPAPAIQARDLPTLNYYNWAETEEIVGNAIDSVFSQDRAPEDAWAQAERELQ
jgi:ABC-type glycerol-3-phosphate transport system substrate-binding protein